MGLDMIHRPLWMQKLSEAWAKRSIIWLSGVRRVGKTTLAQMIPDAEYVSCDLPSVRRSLQDPEFFLSTRDTNRPLVLDEVHRIRDPSTLLKIAADQHPNLRVLATGSSTLAATGKFRDSLTGRKQSVHLRPVLWEECASPFGVADLDRRLLHGGLPEFLLATKKENVLFLEWMDSFYARDILELFNIRNRQGFLSLFQILLRQSGGQVDYSGLASLSGLSRPTVMSHIEALQVAHAVHLVRPYHGGGKAEIVRRPKCYGFDTGFVTLERGWHRLREDDRGVLWEHLVLDALRLRYADSQIFYWQNKSNREVDFVIRRENGDLDTLECKINPDRVSSAAVTAFRQLYPRGENYVVAPVVANAHVIKKGGLVFKVCSTGDL